MSDLYAARGSARAIEVICMSLFEHKISICMQVAAGLTTGALGIMIASPTDLVKVRMQAEQGKGPKRYPNARAAYGIIVRRAPPSGSCVAGLCMHGEVWYAIRAACSA